MVQAYNAKVRPRCDGKLDIVFTTSAGSFLHRTRLRVRFIRSKQTKLLPQSSGLIGAQPMVATIADIDDDGKPDIVVSSIYSSSNTISVIRNTTTSGASFLSGSPFAAALTFSTASQPLGICSGDFDRDGLPDIAVVCSAANVVSIFPNTSTVGSISFGTRIDSAVGITPIDITTGDIDGDGKIDLLLSNAGLASTNFTAHRNISSGSGVFSFAGGVAFATGFSPGVLGSRYQR